MKKRIIITEDNVGNVYINTDIKLRGTQTVEQIPETFEEFKEMCKIEDMSECDDEVKIPWHNNTCLYFYEKDGEIICKDEDSCIEMIIGYDRTPQQMWESIKNLIGEE